MTTTTDAIRQRAGRYAETSVGSAKTILAIQLANEGVPVLLAEIDELTAALRDALAELKDRSTEDAP